jgi:hypothetical protein
MSDMCSRHEGNEKCVKKCILLGKPEWKNHSEDLHTAGRMIILK